ncbi:Tigger transposable element-derived protein 1-like 126, partial [Homarus americanus]
MDRMERLLQDWIQDQTRRHLPLSTAIIMAMASNIWVTLKAESTESSGDAPFKASPGWFRRFKWYTNLHKLRLTGEAARADVVTQSCMNAVWRKVWPECMHDLSGFMDVVAVHCDIASTSQEAGFQEVDEENVAKVLDSHTEELSIEDLLLLEQQQRIEESTGEEENPAPMMLTLKVLSQDHLDTRPVHSCVMSSPLVLRGQDTSLILKNNACFPPQ